MDKPLRTPRLRFGFRVLIKKSVYSVFGVQVFLAIGNNFSKADNSENTFPEAEKGKDSTYNSFISDGKQKEEKLARKRREVSSIGIFEGFANILPGLLKPN